MFRCIFPFHFDIARASMFTGLLTVLPFVWYKTVYDPPNPPFLCLACCLQSSGPAPLTVRLLNGLFWEVDLAAAKYSTSFPPLYAPSGCVLRISSLLFLQNTQRPLSR